MREDGGNREPAGFADPCLKGIALYPGKAGQKGPLDKRYGRFVTEALFATITNVNFDNDRITALIRETLALRDGLKK